MTSKSFHAIRLRGPWQYVPMARTELLSDGTTRELGGDLPPPGRCQVPTDWAETLGPEFRGRVQFQRSFGCPTGLEPGDRVDLVIGPVDAWGSVTLNALLLGRLAVQNSGARFDVTNHLAKRNLLCIEVEWPQTAGESKPLHRPGCKSQPGGVVGEVRLEIFEAGGEG